MSFHVLFPTAGIFISGVKQQGLLLEIVYLLAELEVRMFPLPGCFVVFLIPCQRERCVGSEAPPSPSEGPEMVWGSLISTVSLLVNSNNTWQLIIIMYIACRLCAEV